MRVVLDTNVLVSTLLFTGLASELVSLWQKGNLTVLLSSEILDEYLQVLAYPRFQLSEEEVKGLVEDELLPFMQVIKPGTRIHIVKREPSDNKFLECAVAGRADVLISGDKELLAIRHYRQVRMQAPSRFLETFFRRQSR